MKEKLSVLIIDDSKDMVEVLSRHTSTMGFNPFSANSVLDGIQILESTSIDFVITDMKIPEISGEQLVKYMSHHFPNIPILVITGFPDVRDAVEVMKLGALEYLIKPFTYEELEQSIVKVLGDHRVSQIIEAPNLRTSFHGIIGKSQAMQQLYSTIEKTKNNVATILITGESGTGKEMVARAIHYNSKFSAAPFVPVNCGAIPESLLESELFGHVKGAFTGATTSRIGFFQAAHGGTLFLDEITNSSLSVQAKLLRVIQEKEVTMLGAVKPQKIDLRLISASNSDITELIEKKQFREDLFYRLNIISIHIPPLRDRAEDIPLLVDFFNKKFAKENDKKPLKIGKRIQKILNEYSWPGNVRELENFVHRMVILCEKNMDMEQLPEYMKANLSQKRNSKALTTLAEAERIHILNVLSATNNNKTKAAEILGIDRKTLRSKLK